MNMTSIIQGSYYQTSIYLRLLNIFLAFVVISIYVYSGNATHLVSWGIVGVLLFVFYKAFAKKNICEQNIRTVVIFSYLLLSLVGIISVWFYNEAYGLPFAPYGDDSYYYNNITILASGKMPISFTLYEACMAPVCRLLLIVDPVINVQDLLPLNWALAATAVGISTLLALRIGGRVDLFAPMALLLNYNFIDATVHLYRDCLVLVLTLLCILFAMRKRYFFAVVFAILVGLTRGGNGLLCFLYIFILIMGNNKLLWKFNVTSILVCMLLLILFLGVDSVSNLGGLGRSFSSNTVTEEHSIVEQAKARSDKMLRNDSESFDSIKLLYSIGPLGMVAIPIANVFNPVRWNGLGAYTNVVVRGYDVGIIYVVRPVLVMVVITIILWPVVGPRLVQGLRFCFKSSGQPFALIIMFFSTVLAISLISFQARHRTAFEIFFPCFVTLGIFKTRADRNRRKFFMLFFISLVIGANLFQFFM